MEQTFNASRNNPYSSNPLYQLANAAELYAPARAPEPKRAPEIESVVLRDLFFSTAQKSAGLCEHLYKNKILSLGLPVIDLYGRVQIIVTGSPHQMQQAELRCLVKKQLQITSIAPGEKKGEVINELDTLVKADTRTFISSGQFRMILTCTWTGRSSWVKQEFFKIELCSQRVVDSLLVLPRGGLPRLARELNSSGLLPESMLSHWPHLESLQSALSAYPLSAVFFTSLREVPELKARLARTEVAPPISFGHIKPGEFLEGLAIGHWDAGEDGDNTLISALYNSLSVKRIGSKDVVEERPITFLIEGGYARAEKQTAEFQFLCRRDFTKDEAGVYQVSLAGSPIATFNLVVSQDLPVDMELSS